MERELSAAILVCESLSAELMGFKAGRPLPERKWRGLAHLLTQLEEAVVPAAQLARHR